MANRYWVGSSGNWTDTSHWSTSSGGAGGSSVPTASDDVVIDNNSSSVALNIVLDAPPVSGISTTPIGSLTMTNTAFSVAFDKASGTTLATVESSGSLGFSAASSSPNIVFEMLAGGFLTQGNTTSYSLRIQINSTGTVNLTTDFIGNTISVAKGTFRSNGNTIRLGSFSSSNGGASSINLDDSSMLIGEWIGGFGSAGLTSFSAARSTLLINGSNRFWGGGLTYNIVILSSTVTLVGNASFAELRLSPGRTYTFTAGTTHTIGSLTASGTTTSPIFMRSSTPGTRFNLSKSTGTIGGTYLDIQDSNATGGATWTATNSVNSGNNAGWTFVGPTNVIVYPLSIDSSSDVGDVSAYPGNSVRQMGTIEGDATFGTLTVGMTVTGLGGVTSSPSVSSLTVVQSPPPPPPPTDWEAIGNEDQKVYVYRVYTAAGVFIGTWNDVGDDPEFTQRINTPGTSMTVKLNRSPDTTKEIRVNLVDQAGNQIVGQDDSLLVTTFETNNSVGASTDLDINYNVDVYVHYGSFDFLIGQDGSNLVDENGNFLVASSGSPEGRRIFSGYVLDYELNYGRDKNVTATLISHGAELSQALVRDGETIVVNYSSQELSTTLKSVLDTNPGKMTYSLDSIANTGTSAAFKYQLNSKLEAIETIYDQSPDGWYWYGDVATNLIVFKQKASVPDHTFKLGYHIKNMALKRTQEQLRNLVYFVGDEVSGVSILKKYQDTTSQTAWRVGLHRITDRRYSVPANMQRRGEKEMANYKGPVWTTTLTISSARYDIETIKLGQVVGFANLEGELRDLQLQIMSIGRGRTYVDLQVGGYLDRQSDLIDEVSDGLANEQFQTIPNAPS